MKVLVVANVLDGTGWAAMGQHFALALDAAGVDVVVRPLKLNNRREAVPQRIEQLLNKPSQGCEVCLQIALPNMMEYDGRFKANIGLFCAETSHFKGSGWARKLNLMDEVWVLNREMLLAARESEVTRPIRVVPLPADTTRYERNYRSLEILSPYRETGEFLFYTIGEHTRRKNLEDIVRAFHGEFDRADKVRLLIKSDDVASVREFCGKIRKDLKLPRLREEIVVGGRMTDEEILRLHASCDCFVSASRGESWCLPAFDSLALGKTPICTDSTGFREYIRDNVDGWLVRSNPTACWGATDTLDYLYRGDEYWDAISNPSLRAAMRQAHQLSEEQRQEMAGAGLARAYEFSYGAVGPLLRKLVEQHVYKTVAGTA